MKLLVKTKLGQRVAAIFSLLGILTFGIVILTYVTIMALDEEHALLTEYASALEES